MTAITQERRRMTVAEYLVAEEAAEFRSEFWNGEAFAMAGASPEHEPLNANIGAAVLAAGIETYPLRANVKVPPVRSETSAQSAGAADRRPVSPLVR